MTTTAPHYQDERVTLYHADSLTLLRSDLLGYDRRLGYAPPLIPDNSVDSVPTDPPYGLSNTTPAQVLDCLTHWVAGDREYVPPTGRGFMGAEWDAFVPPPAVWDEVFRVLKPGGHLLAFAGSRTQDLMGLSIRLAGFDVRDGLAWLFGSGFPKSLDVSKAVTAHETTGGSSRRQNRQAMTGDDSRSTSYGSGPQTATTTATSTPPPRANLTDAAREWEGWGTALKPAFEPIIVARKPFPGTVAQNVLAHGTGALNLDACRVEATDPQLAEKYASVRNAPPRENGVYGADNRPRDECNVEPHSGGRWPANVLLGHVDGCEQVGTVQQVVGGGAAGSSGFVDGYQPGSGFVGREVETDLWECAPGCPVAALDAQSGPLHTQDPATRNAGRKPGWSPAGTDRPDLDKNNPSGGLSEKGRGASKFFPAFRYQAKAPTRERPVYVDEDGTKVAHPTVKPLALMQWLVRLVTPRGGLVLEPFPGSGTTIEAALLEGMRVLAAERGAEYLPLIEQRIDRVYRPRAVKPKPKRTAAPVDDAMDLLSLIESA